MSKIIELPSQIGEIGGAFICFIVAFCFLIRLGALVVSLKPSVEYFLFVPVMVEHMVFPSDRELLLPC